jgi:hypothetical protein
LRELVAARLPLPCVNCPHVVLPEHSWQVGHIIDAAVGGQPTPTNVGASHAFCPWCKRKCNQSAGGRLGAAITNSRKAHAKGRRAW